MSGVLELKDVHKSYPLEDGTRLPVLTGLDLKASKRQFISLVGPSGCGKSTLFRLLLGMESPTNGSIEVAGEPVVNPDRTRGIVFQNYSLFPHLTVLENVIFGLELEGIAFLDKYLRFPRYRRLRTAWRAEGIELLSRFRLEAHAGKYPHELSGGMRQRVAIAQAAIMKPHLLLLDEPFGALDDDIRRQCQIFLDQAYEETEMTIIFVTHNIHEAVLLADRLVVLSPYYTADNPARHGSRIVFDVAVSEPRPRTTEFESHPAFASLIADIRTIGLDPDKLQHRSEFRLTHPDAAR